MKIWTGSERDKTDGLVRRKTAFQGAGHVGAGARGRECWEMEVGPVRRVGQDLSTWDWQDNGLESWTAEQQKGEDGPMDGAFNKWNY